MHASNEAGVWATIVQLDKSFFRRGPESSTRDRGSAWTSGPVRPLASTSEPESGCRDSALDHHDVCSEARPEQETSLYRRYIVDRAMHRQDTCIYTNN